MPYAILQADNITVAKSGSEPGKNRRFVAVLEGYQHGGIFFRDGFEEIGQGHSATLLQGRMIS